MPRFRAAAAAAVLALAGNAALAQSYPWKTIRIVVPFPPGGGTDLMGRLLAQKLAAPLGQQLIVDNRAGAGGRIGAELVAKSAPDGHTLLLAGSSVLATAPALYARLPFEMPKDFAPISLVAYTGYVVIMHPSVPARTVKDLVALARARPGRLTYASSGTGSQAHLAGELFASMARVKMIHVPYKGSAPGTLSVIAGETDLMFSNIVAALPSVKTGRLRPLAVTNLTRSAIMPEVPTAAESGLPGFDVRQIYGLLAAAGTPREIVARLNQEVGRVLQTEDTRSKLLTDGSEVLTSTPEELEKTIVSEIAKWTRVIRETGIREE